MRLIDHLTPKNTEELKPGLFIQKRGKGYKQIYPIAWNGKIRYKEQWATIFSWRTFFTVGLVLFIAWSYLHDVKEFRDFYIEVSSNPVLYCTNVFQNLNQNPLGEIEVENVKQQLDPDALQGYP